MKSLVTITVITLTLAVAAAVITQDPDTRYVKTNDCIQIYRTASDKKIYCGKACWQKADLVTYKCNSDKSQRTILQAR